jgi:hypothetical protein
MMGPYAQLDAAAAAGAGGDTGAGAGAGMSGDAGEGAPGGETGMDIFRDLAPRAQAVVRVGA